MSAYEAGAWTGRLLFIVVGMGLLLTAFFSRRSADRRLQEQRRIAAAAVVPVLPAATPPGSAAGGPWGAAAPPSLWAAPPPERRAPWSTGLVVAGSVLLGLGVLVLVMAGAEHVHRAHHGAAVPTSAASGAMRDREFAFPASVLGMDRDIAASQQLKQQVGEGSLAGAVYTKARVVVLVYVLTSGDHGDLKAALADFRRGYNQTGGNSLDTGTDVAPGPLGGAARCWSTSGQDSAETICAFADPGSLLVVIDNGERELQAAAERAREVRAATEH